MLLGFMGIGITLTVGFFPPATIDAVSHLHYELLFSSDMIVMILPVLLLKVR